MMTNTRNALVIDDSRAAADTLAGMLRILGYKTQVAYGPRTAINSFTREFPSLIVLDIHMPGMDGVEVCRFLKRDPRTAHVAVIAMSSESQPEMIERVRAAGADIFLPKPVSLEMLEQALQKVEKGAAKR
jgi:CheY-like chemotaxis protein